MAMNLKSGMERYAVIRPMERGVVRKGLVPDIVQKAVET